MKRKKMSKFFAVLLSAAMSVGTGIVPAAAEMIPEAVEDTDIFTAEPEEAEDASAFSQGGEAEVFTEAAVQADGFSDTEEAISLAGLPILAEDVPDNGSDVIAVPQVQYIALGDSISTGYGLTDTSRSFVQLLAAQNGFLVNNLAVDGLTSDLLLAALASGQYDAMIALPDTITLTIGGNDMMAAFYALIAETYNQASGQAVTAAEIPQILNNMSDPQYSAVLQAAMQILGAGYDQVQPAFNAVLAQTGQNIKNIAAYIKAKNPDVTLLVATQYNPYQWMTGLYASLNAFMDGGAKDLNAQITNAENGAGTLYTVVDVYSAFAASADNLCNAAMLPLNLDFHPNADGHAVIAAQFQAYMPKEEEAVPVIASVSAAGNTVYAGLEDVVEGAGGYDFVIGTAQDCIVTRDYVQVCKNQKDPTAGFYYIPEGTYYVFCHSWVRGEDGLKQFSDWSEGYQVSVTATTPQQPKITKATVKGNTVTVTYTKCEDATGYDLVLGTAVKKVNKETRPVSYGKNVIKAGNRVTVTFKNVKAGTYYLGVHAYNRTSEDGKKVFSPWSVAKKVVVK